MDCTLPPEGLCPSFALITNLKCNGLEGATLWGRTLAESSARAQNTHRIIMFNPVNFREMNLRKPGMTLKIP